MARTLGALVTHRQIGADRLIAASGKRAMRMSKGFRAKSGRTAPVNAFAGRIMREQIRRTYSEEFGPNNRRRKSLSAATASGGARIVAVFCARPSRATSRVPCCGAGGLAVAF